MGHGRKAFAPPSAGVGVDQSSSQQWRGGCVGRRTGHGKGAEPNVESSWVDRFHRDIDGSEKGREQRQGKSCDAQMLPGTWMIM